LNFICLQSIESKVQNSKHQALSTKQQKSKT
jgi:hypothetical protein